LRSSLAALVSVCAVIGCLAFGIGYAFSMTGTADLGDNQIEGSYLVIYTTDEDSQGSKKYIGNFSEPVEFHTGTVIKDGQRTTVYTPCSWYMETYDGYYELGYIDLAIRSSGTEFDLRLSIVPDNPDTIYTGAGVEEYEYFASVKLGDTTQEPQYFDVQEGIVFDFDSDQCDDI